MDLTEIDNKVKELIGFEDLGFYEHENYDRNHYMFKKSGEAIYKIGYEFFPKVGRRELGFNGAISYNIIFPQVNQVLMSVLDSGDYTDSFGSLMKTDLDESTLSDLEDNYLMMHEFERNNKVLPFIEEDIYYEDRLMQGSAVQKKCIERFALPFFKQFTTLQQVNDEIINTIPWQDLTRRIPGQTPFKRMIIMKLCNNPAYGEFADMFGGRVRGAVENGMKQYQSYNGALIALRNYLENGRFGEIGGEPVQRSMQKVSVQDQVGLLPLSRNNVFEERFAQLRNVLKNAGVTFSDRFLLDDYRRDANWQSWGIEAKDGNDLLYHLLLFAGTNVLDSHTGSYEPVSPDVYYFNAGWDGFVDYGKIIHRLNLLTGNALHFTEVAGRFDDGHVGVSFRYKEALHQWEFEYDGDWTDLRIFNQFMELVKADLIHDFYILPEGQGGLVFYFSEGGRDAFELIYKDKQLMPLAEFYG